MSPVSSWQTVDDDDRGHESYGSESGPSDETEGDDGQMTLYYDAEEGTLQAGNGTWVAMSNGDEANNETEAGMGGDDGSRMPVANVSGHEPRQSITATQGQILQLLSLDGLGRLLQMTGGTRPAVRPRISRTIQTDDDDEAEAAYEDDDGDIFYLGSRARRWRPRRPLNEDPYPKIPSEEGKKLMDSGTFGTNDHCDHSACGLPYSDLTTRKQKKFARRMFDREVACGPRGRTAVLNGLVSQALVPRSKADHIIPLGARGYSGQFSEDGSFFFACGQDFKVKMYDTSNPYEWKYYKTAHYHGGHWTITDASLSPDNRLLAYSSIQSQVCLANTEQDDHSEPRFLDFANMGPAGQSGGGARGIMGGHFGIWSLRFSGDGREIVAGTSNNSVYVYDLQTQRSILQIRGHSDEVNAVCFGDRMSPHILYSGSDDTTLKVWDRRSLHSMRPAGMFLGHTEGLTYIDSKGDGRYVVSNGKDQTCKLWDLRRMVSTDEGEKINPQAYTTNFEYRFSSYHVEDHQPHPHDCSLVTFRGHRVLKTLIRCHFSPPGSTNGRYVYSGSHDGKVYVWNLDGTQAADPIDVYAATKSEHLRHGGIQMRRPVYHYGGSCENIVRDCSWHPSAPVLAATSWNGPDHDMGTCTVHSWDDDAVETDEAQQNKEAKVGSRHYNA